MDVYLFIKFLLLIVLSVFFLFFRFYKVFKGYLYFVSCVKFVIKGNNGGNIRIKKLVI